MIVIDSNDVLIDESTVWVIVATAGYYSKIHIVEGAGVDCDPRAPISPEQLAEQWDQITALRDPQPYFDSYENLRAVMAKE